MADESSPDWLNKGDNAWQLTAATLVALQSMPGLVILYGGFSKHKWAVNSSVMAVYAFAATLICWVGWGYRMSFGDKLLDFVGRPGPALDENFLLGRAFLGGFPTATMVWFQFVFAAIAPVLVAGALLGRMNFAAWMAFVPLWHTLSYTVGAYSVWNPEGWLAKMGVIDFAGGFVIHLSSGVAGFTAAYWVGPRSDSDRKRFPPNNIVMMLGGAGLLWMGWTGFNGGAPYAASAVASLAVINTHVCAAVSLVTWLVLDFSLLGKPSAVGAVNGAISGLVCITPAAGLVQCWAAMLMGLLSGTVPWYTLNRVGPLRRAADDAFAVLHTHAVAGALGGLLAGVFAVPKLCRLFYGEAGGWEKYVGLAYAVQSGRNSAGLRQMGTQLVGVAFIVCLNVVATTLICLVIKGFVPLRMSEEAMKIGDEEIHGEVVSISKIEGESSPRFFKAKVNSMYEDEVVSKTPTYEMHRV
ncbi:ammonium transporter 2 member 4-like [Salvia miltiorrhiza]|uniref:ammonium transporter 2 member 4-like n=1 Tax=Salvia miltiorrhiza TaxID=226208 RepID=UPI0025ACC8EF|nr:ammonium transporter 2 member 4-like [Salvia miltiorrhiza]